MMTARPSIPDRPTIPCPDCGASMRLHHTPAQFKTKNPFVYLCDHRPEGCRGLMSAHPDGRPMGKPQPAEVRFARRCTHEVFDRLWMNAPMMYHIRETGPEREEAIKRIRQTARKRAYSYVAHHLGMSVKACHIGKITSLDKLRQFYRVARAATPQSVRDWWKETQSAEAVMVPIPPAELPKMIGKPIHLKGAGPGHVWILEKIRGETLFLRTPTTDKPRMASIGQALYARRHQPEDAGSRTSTATA